MITINDKCLKLIQSFEGCVLKPYHGAADRPDVFTIGWGTIKYPLSYLNGKMVAMSDPAISQELADDFLHYEVSRIAAAIDPLLRDDLTPNQFGALLSFTYNLGEGALRQSTLRRKLNANPADPTIRDEFVKWVHSDGKVQPGLVRRRKAEADLYFTP